MSLHCFCTYFAFILGSSLTNKGGVVDETILGSVFAGLQGSKKSLLSSKDLHSGGRMLRQIQKGALKIKNGQKLMWTVSAASPEWRFKKKKQAQTR